MADRTVEFILKLTTQQFTAGSENAQKAVKGLGDAAHNAVMRGVNPLNIRLAATTAGSKAYAAALREGASATEASSLAAQAAAAAVEQLGRAQVQARKETEAATDATEAAAKAWDALASKTSRQMQLVRDAADVGGEIAEGFIAAGAAISGPLLLSMNEYLQNADAADRVARRWNASTERLSQSQQRIGREVAQAVLPLLEEAARVAEKAAAFAERNPDAVRAALNMGVAMATLGAVGVAVSRGIKLYADARQLVAEALAWKMQNQAADKQLAAAAMQAGKSAGGGAGAVASNVTGSSVVATAGLVVAGVAATGAVVSLTNQLLEQTGMAEKIRAAQSNIQATGRAYPGVVQPAGAQAGSSQSFLGSLGSMDALNNVDDAATALGRLSQALGDAVRQAGQSEWLAQVAAASQQVTDIEGQSAAQRKGILRDFAADSAAIERQRGRETQLEALRAGWELADAEKRIAQQRRQIAETYQTARAKAEEQFAQAQAQAAQQHARRQEDIERQYRKRLADIQKQYATDEFEATLNRDASALFRAQRRRDEEIASAGQERAEQQGQAGQQYQDALAQAQAARQQSLAQAQAARQESLVQLEQSIQQELEAQRRADERARQEQALQDRWMIEDRKRALIAQLAQAQAGYTAELQLAREHQRQLRLLDPSYKGGSGKGSAGSTKGSGKIPSKASGGYTDGGLALLHPGEFVLNPQTTRRLEGAVGGGLTQNNVTQGGVNITANFTGMGQQDQSWFRVEMENFKRQVTEAIS